MKTATTPRTLRSTLRLFALGAAAAVVLSPYAADSGTCTNPAAMDLLATSNVDSMLNSPKGEDTNFFIRAGGVPNIMMLLDVTGSMNRLPPDGPSWFSGTLPPGYNIGNNYSNQAAAFAANATTAAPNTRIVGCGIDPVSAGSAAFTSSGMYQTLENRRFYPPCGTAVDPALVGAPFQGQGIDYAAQMTVCPYFTSSNNQTFGAPGFDPDYYDGADPMGTSAGSKDIFFGRSLVFHDNPSMTTLNPGAYARVAANAFGHNFGDGWAYDGVYPHLDKANPGNKSTIATFCAQQGTVAPQTQGTLSHSAICNTCLNTKGWYYDGVIYTAGENNNLTGAPTPSIWYTGNYLNHFPPKFLVERKVLKDIIAVQSRVRMAMATFSGNVGVGPVSTFVQPFNPSCGMPDNSSFDSNRASYVNGVDQMSFGGGTPMATALFDVGRYYHSPGLQWFGNTWEAGNAYESSGTSNQFAVCYSCQSSSVILITDGQPSGDDGDKLPPLGLTAAQIADANKYAGNSGTGILGIKKDVCPECDAFPDTGTEAYKDNLAKVAFYLHNMDLRLNTEGTLDCKTNQGPQSLDVYTLGFATKSIASVNTILGNAAKAGGGIFISADNTKELKDGFNAILEEINGRSTSFSVATVSTLQTTSGRAVIVPRFQPGKTAHWLGHVYRYDLYSEFVNGCTPFGKDDYNCDGRCDGAFLMDADGDFISEDGNGLFVKNDPVNKVVCGQAPRCGTNCAVPGSAPAKAFWDGADSWGSGLDDKKQEWKTRNVWTVVDKDLDGDLQADDLMVKLEADNSAAKEIVPYLALGGGTVCNTVSGRFASAGWPAQATLVAGDPVECAKSIIRYVLGADLFNERGKTDGSYPPSSQDDAVDRDYLLGDVFHSSPVVVQAPFSRKGILADFENQALPALWGTPTVDGAAGYDAYSLSTGYRDRRKVVLVGGNDGMLHAFNGGRFLANADDPTTPGLDEKELGGYYEPGTLDGAMELWAFVPPDMLSKLPLLLGTEHQLYVDGTAMVRDVWVDGTSNAVGGGSRNDKKEGGEFHTMAVVGERRGGTRFFALDVSDASEPDTRPEFKWIYPQPNSPESLQFGETYDDFLPTPPPIGPVRVAADGTHPANADTPLYTFDGSNTPFHERWIVFLNGGYDPQFVRGRGVHMVDVWTGQEIFDFSFTPGAADPRAELRFPVPAAVGMVNHGTLGDKQPDFFDAEDLFFDTATFGDAGGQLWTLRFHAPGKLGAGGLVTNWVGGRAFQMGGQTTCKLCGAQPFFYITANNITPNDRILRTYIGTGDRYNLTDKYGGSCSPANLRACVMRGCTVTVTAANNQLAAPGPGLSQAGFTEAACGAMANTDANGSVGTCSVIGGAKVVISGCPSPDPNTALTTTTKEVAVTCAELADGYSCTRGVNSPGQILTLSNTKDFPVVGNWFFSFRVFRDGNAADPLARPLFNDLAGAKTYDAHRLYVTQNGTVRTASPDLVMIDSTVLAPATLATEESSGWAIYYNHGPTVTIDGTTVNVDWKDERTASGTALGPIVSWNAVQPPTSSVSSGGSCRVSKCSQEDRRVNYLYAADPVTGGPSGLFLDANGNMIRSSASYRLVPAQALQPTTFVNAKGQVSEAMTGVSPEQGAINIGGTEAQDPVSEAGVLLIDKDVYECRHAKTPKCE